MSHGQGYDNSPWKSNYVPVDQHGNAVSPNNQNQNQNQQQISNATWQYAPTSGYSSASPPNTTSSEGSPTNSQYFCQSPEDVSVDSLISSLLKVVNVDDFGINNARLPSPENYSICHDCNINGLCEACTAKSLQLNSLCNEQLLMRPLTAEIPSPPRMIRHIPNGVMPLYCEIHREAQRYYCQTCSKPFCADCGVQQHVAHVTVHLVDALENAGVKANLVMREAKIGMSILRDELDEVQMAAEALDQKAREATTDVMMCIRRAASALEAREKDLLGKIEKARLSKFAALKSRDETLRNCITRLNRVVHKLGDAMDSATLASNPYDLITSKDMTSAEIFHARYTRHHMPPLPEENWISFISGDSNALQAIANLGTIIDNNPGPIGDRRTVRGRGHGGVVSPQRMSPQFHPNNSPSPQGRRRDNKMVSMVPLPPGHAIPATSYPVIVRTGRSGQKPNGLAHPIKIIGNEPDGRDNLCRPWGIAVDNEGQLIVADRSNNRIMIYRADGSLVKRFGTHGTGPGQFDRPAGVAVDGRRRIIVADKDNHRVQALSMDGTYLLSFGEKGSRCGQFNYPWDVAVNSECQIAVSDTRNHRVQLFSAEGIFLAKFGYEAVPTMWKHFDSPRGVAFNPAGNCLVTDFNNHRVIAIEADFLNARVVVSDSVNNIKQFLRPQGLIVDDEGNIIVADSRNHRIQIFDSTGTLKWKFGTHGKGLDEMDRPSGIALTPDGRIAVVDFGNNRVMLI